jgi:uncharacterized protein YcbK (DUF882 family)
MVPRLALAASLVVIGCESLQNAVAEGDTRTISLHHLHTGESLTVTYKRNGRYDEEALKKLNHILRDWRRNEEVRMDPHLIDLVWEVRRDLDATAPIEIVCGYRAPATNEMLRHRSRHSGVARFSQHTLGKAIDFYIPGVRLEDLRAMGLRLQRGGVGFYPTSGSPFVHLDIGSVRHWPRMTREQLVRIFPDGRTVHIPADGHPLPGYALALADIEKRGNEPSALSLAAARDNGVSAARKPNLLAKLFGFGKAGNADEEDDAASASASATPQAAAARTKPVRTETVSKPQMVAANIAAAAVPLPPAKPVAVQTAKIETVRVAAAKAEPTNGAARKEAHYTLAAAEPSNLFDRRGYWGGAITADIPADDRPLAPQATDAAPEATGKIGPWPASLDRPDRVPSELALAYAAQAGEPQNLRAAPQPVRAAAPMGAKASTPTEKTAPPATTVARKSDSIAFAPALAVAEATAPARKFAPSADDPWLRAMVLTPNVAGYMATTLLGTPDYRQLQPLLRRPSSALVMAFSDDPLLGISAERFTGSAIAFLASTTFGRQTAALQ